ncbi:hypothetical protein [Formosa haliotis]|uniref:hypothetical protein n=1 Tax=Formosa haliotis TaxID=1555194 RepID=UPI0008252542|nr:hypothetical protein [Formosa haliotis]
MSLSEINQKIEQAKPLDFGIIFSQSIELFKKIWQQGLVIMLLMVAIILPFYFIIYVPFLMLGVDRDALNSTQEMNPILLILVGLFFLLFVIIASAASLGFQAAFYRICKQKDLGEVAKDDYFYFFRKPYFKKLIQLSLAITGISFLCGLLCALPLIYAMVPLSFISVVFAFNPDLSVSELVKVSFKLGNKKWLLTFGLLIVCGILAELLGLLMCFVGLFVTASFAYLPLYIIYKEVIGFENLEDDSILIETQP